MAASASNRLSLVHPAVGLGADGLRQRVARVLQPTGVPELDGMLGGGWPRGSLIELCGPAFSGRTSLAFSLLSQATRQQEVCAVVDVTDSLDPFSLAASQVELSRLLWIRCGKEAERGQPGKPSSPFEGKRTDNAASFFTSDPAATFAVPNRKNGGKKPWKPLEQALKSVDLLLHSGGWGVVVLDLGGISWMDSRRINQSMWFRFRSALEGTPTILLVIGEKSCAGSSAALLLQLERKASSWKSAVPDREDVCSTFAGMEVQGEVIRSRDHSQPPGCASWQTRTHSTLHFQR